MNVVKWELYYEISRAKQLWEVRKQFKLPFELHKLPGGNSTCKVCWQKFLDVNFKTFSAQLSNIISKMWPSTGNKKSATISGWQALGDFASVKQQLQKIRASTRVSSSKKGHDLPDSPAPRPLPPLPPVPGKSVRFSLPGGGPGPGGAVITLTSSEGSDQGYESDQSRVGWQTQQYIIIGSNPW